MSRIEHRFVRGIRAQTELQYEVQGKQRLVHHTLPMTQSVIDSACGLISTLQAVMILQGIPRPQIERLSSARSGPLKKLWAIAQSHYFEGAGDEDIAQYVSAFAPALESAVVGGSATRIAKAVAKAIEQDAVSLIQLESRTWAHWTTCVAIELDADTKVPLALLCIDPAAPAPWAVPFSARLELRGPTVKGRAQLPLVYRYASEGERWNVRICSAVIVSRAQPP